MFRKGLRWQFGSPAADLDVPLGLIASGNHLKYDGTQILGVAGVDVTGTPATSDVLQFNGTNWVPKHRSLTIFGGTATTPTTAGPTTLQTVISVALPRAGSYFYRVSGLYLSNSATAMTMGVGMAYSAASGSFVIETFGQNTATTVTGATGTTIASAVLIATTAASAQLPCSWYGSFNAGAAGTLSAQFNKLSGVSAAGNSYSMFGTIMEVMEA